jgi:hypothetical protein
MLSLLLLAVFAGDRTGFRYQPARWANEMLHRVVSRCRYVSGRSLLWYVQTDLATLQHLGRQCTTRHFADMVGCHIWTMDSSVAFILPL